MREIKFRGLTAKNTWVYGDLRHDLPGSTVYYNEYPHRICWQPETGGEANQPVKKGTVGQYTGLKDKNGVEIYEGDVVKGKYFSGTIGVFNRIIGVVSYRGCEFKVKGFGKYEGLVEELNMSFEIINNIHEMEVNR